MKDGTITVCVDRVEEHIAVCYSPEGGMIDIPLPEEVRGSVRDGSALKVRYMDGAIISVEICGVCDSEAQKRRERLDRLFRKNK